MTWSARIADSEGNFPVGKWQACDACKHGYAGPKITCYLPKLGQHIGPMFTSIDTGADGYMAGGFALLKCYGYEPITK